MQSTSCSCLVKRHMRRLYQNDGQQRNALKPIALSIILFGGLTTFLIVFPRRTVKLRSGLLATSLVFGATADHIEQSNRSRLRWGPAELPAHSSRRAMFVSGAMAAIFSSLEPARQARRARKSESERLAFMAFFWSELRPGPNLTASFFGRGATFRHRAQNFIAIKTDFT